MKGTSPPSHSAAESCTQAWATRSEAAAHRVARGRALAAQEMEGARQLLETRDQQLEKRRTERSNQHAADCEVGQS